jgi:ankyrin repeat protein
MARFASVVASSGNAHSFVVPPIVSSAQEGDLEAVREMLQQDADLAFAAASDRSTALHAAAEAGHREVAKLLLAYKSPIDAVDNQDCTPLHRAALAGRVRMVEFLLANGADVDADYGLEWTPLHCAALKGHRLVAEVLLAHHAKMDAEHSMCGWTPLHYTAMSDYRSVAELLLDAGANVNAESFSGETPLGLAERSGHGGMAELLRQRGGH